MKALGLNPNSFLVSSKSELSALICIREVTIIVYLWVILGIKHTYKWDCFANWKVLIKELQKGGLWPIWPPDISRLAWKSGPSKKKMTRWWWWWRMRMICQQSLLSPLFTVGATHPRLYFCYLSLLCRHLCLFLYYICTILYDQDSIQWTSLISPVWPNLL